MDDKKRFLKGMLLGILLTLVVTGGAWYLTQKSGVFPSGESEEKLTSEKHIEKLNYLQELIDTYYLNDADVDALTESMYAGVLEGLNDPYSRYYTADEYKSLTEETSGHYNGIGVVMQQDENGIISFTRCYENAPGAVAGLKVGDMLYKVDDTEVSGMEVAEVAKKIKSEDTTSVHLTIAREGESDYLEFDITKADVNIPLVEHEMMDNQVGYLAIYEFSDSTYEQFASAYKELQDQGMTSLVIDLRGNPGGLLTSVCDILNDILPKGLIVYTEDKNGKREEQTCEGNTPIDIPLAVLVNGNSASASEIFAGAVQDHGIGTIVGTQTYGKGVVQTIRPLNDGSAVKITISNYYTPNGQNINGVGITPDVEVELDESLAQQNTIEKADDNQLQKAIEVLKQ